MAEGAVGEQTDTAPAPLDLEALAAAIADARNSGRAPGGRSHSRWYATSPLGAGGRGEATHGSSGSYSPPTWPTRACACACACACSMRIWHCIYARPDPWILFTQAARSTATCPRPRHRHHRSH